MVYRVFVEKKKEYANEAAKLLSDASSVLGVKGLTGVRVINRYDAEDITQELFDEAVYTVFAEPQVDIACSEPEFDGAVVFAVEYLPGQFDQRADSAAQCIQIISTGARPAVRSAKVYALYGDLSDADVAEIKKYVINPVEAREAAMEKPSTLKTDYAIPTTVRTLEGFREMDRRALEAFVEEYGLAMDADDAEFCRDYFRDEEHRDPTITEIRMIDTYWSDHCRHTTFGTVLTDVTFEDKLLQQTYEQYLEVRHELGRDEKPVCLMDLATIAVKYLREHGMLDGMDVSEEINACTVKVKIDVDGVSEPWLLLFKNETHNHPTEIEPFGGAATCIGGAIRDPLSGRSYVYAAMRVSGGSDPTVPISETMPGKLPQRKLVTTAAAGYSSYGNQIGLATGIVDEIYHPGYAAKHMEVGAVLGAAPAANVRREVPAPGDCVLYLGGSTGRDGIGGATGSSKAHNAHSVETCGAEVQKGNAPEERKLQRLFRNAAACRMIKRCNDFGAGGVSVAIGELADGLSIDLNAVPRKYDGLDGTELAISESQERMAVVVSPEDLTAFCAIAESENLQVCKVAEVTADPRLIMHWNGRNIVDISREFLNSNGAKKYARASIAAPGEWHRTVNKGFSENMLSIAGDLATCSRRELSERFDSTIGAGSVLMPYGGKYQLTPVQAMAHLIPLEDGITDDCSLMAYGYDPAIAEKSPYHGAYLAVVESVSRLIATGASFDEVYLSFQEFFEKLRNDPARWGKPLSALLGAFRAQMELGIGAIGGTDSMSGSFENLDVPPTLISFAVTMAKAGDIISPEFKHAGSRVVWLRPVTGEDGLPTAGSLKALFSHVHALMQSGSVLSCYTPGHGGAAEAVMKMGFGNGLGFAFDESLSDQEIFGYCHGSFILEMKEGCEADGSADSQSSDHGCSFSSVILGTVTDSGRISRGSEGVALSDLLQLSEGKLQSVYGNSIKNTGKKPENVSFYAQSYPVPAVKCARPRILIPAFPGTNCEVDSARAVREAGAEPEIVIVRNLTSDDIAGSVDSFARKLRDAQAVFIPGGFSGGDEPDGSAKFITAFFRNTAVAEGVTDLLERRDGLMLGICNGFQALIKLGLVPYGRIIETDDTCPTLTFNNVARHQSRIVRTRIASNRSPWLAQLHPGDIVSVPISHGEGRFVAGNELLSELIRNGQIATQYVDMDGNATEDLPFNPNGSVLGIEGITSPDGRVLGKMGHTERNRAGLYVNVPGNYDCSLFASAVKYFRGC